MGRAHVAVFWLSFVLLGYFFGSAGWNQNARLDAIYNFVEPGPDQYTFKINRFLWDVGKGKNTGDWALHRGDYYANKAPGTILLGAVFYLPLHWFETHLLGWSVSDPRIAIANAYLANLFVSVLWLSLAAVVFYEWLRRSGERGHWPATLTLLCLFATAMFPYGSQMWGHTTAGAFVVFGYAALWQGTDRSTRLAGMMLGFAVCMDYLAVLHVLLAGAFLLAQRRAGLLPYAVGGALPLLVLAAYQFYCFDHPFTTAPSLAATQFLDEDRVFQVFGLATSEALFQLSVGPMRGVFYQMPVLLLAPIGFWFWWRRDRRDPWLWMCASSFVVPFLVVAGFNGWHGGATVMARYLIPALPWLVVALKELPKTRSWLVALGLAGGLSFLNMTAIAATNPVGAGDADPLYGWAYPHFFAADLMDVGLPTRLQERHPEWLAIAPLTCFNLGELVGLKRFSSFIPFFVLALASAFALVRIASPARPSSPPALRPAVGVGGGTRQGVRARRRRSRDPR